MWFLNLIKSQFVSIRQCLTTSANSAIPNAEPKANSQQIHLFDCFLWPSRFWIWNVWPEASQSQVSPVWWWLDRGGCGCHKQPERALREKLQPLQATSTTLYWAEKKPSLGTFGSGLPLHVDDLPSFVLVSMPVAFFVGRGRCTCAWFNMHFFHPHFNMVKLPFFRSDDYLNGYLLRRLFDRIRKMVFVFVLWQHWLWPRPNQVLATSMLRKTDGNKALLPLRAPFRPWSATAWSTVQAESYLAPKLCNVWVLSP